MLLTQKTPLRAAYPDLATAITMLASGEVRDKGIALRILDASAIRVRDANSAEDLGFALGLSGKWSRLPNPFNPKGDVQFYRSFEFGRLLAMEDDPAKHDCLLELGGYAKPRWRKLQDALPVLESMLGVALALVVSAAVIWTWPVSAEDRSHVAALDAKGQAGYSLSDRLSLNNLRVTSCTDGPVENEGHPKVDVTPPQVNVRTQLANNR
jgi:hypothetical protein